MNKNRAENHLIQVLWFEALLGLGGTIKEETNIANKINNLLKNLCLL